MFFKIGVLKDFARFTRKYLCWSLFLKKLQAFRHSNLLKRLKHRCFLLNSKSFQSSFFKRAPSVAASSVSHKFCYNSYICIQHTGFNILYIHTLEKINNVATKRENTPRNQSTFYMCRWIFICMWDKRKLYDTIIWDANSRLVEITGRIKTGKCFLFFLLNMRPCHKKNPWSVRFRVRFRVRETFFPEGIFS